MSIHETPAVPGDEPVRPLPPARPRIRNFTQPAQADVEAEPQAQPGTPLGAAPKHEYQVGYAKPPRHSQFKPGQSGNPKGRPPGAKSLQTIAREILTERIPVKRGDGTARKMTRMEALFTKLAEAAAKGNPRAMEQLIKLYLASVPDVTSVPAAGAASSIDELTAADFVILSQFLQSVQHGSQLNEEEADAHNIQ